MGMTPRHPKMIGYFPPLAVLAIAVFAWGGPAMAQQPTKIGEIFQDCTQCPEMVALPTGTYAMGTQDGAAKEQPVHLVSISGAIAMSRFEITWDQWGTCFAAGWCERDPDDHGWGRGLRPVVNVSWEEAKLYAEWVSEMAGATYRLPSESEWEFAARAGTYTAYPWGDEIGEENANCRECNTQLWDHQSIEVGQYAPNAFGLYDMHGNIWEWIEDCWADDYVGAPQDGTARQDGDCGRRVVRSGSWYYFPQLARSASRDNFPAHLFSYNIGIRLVREM